MFNSKHFQINGKSQCFFFLIIIIPIFLSAQERSFGTLPLVNNGELIKHQEGNLNDTEEYQHILGIYEKLVQARGDMRYKVPTLYLKDEEGHVASIDYGTFDITLEKKAYDICKKYGDDAIAFLLGHELTHYYEKHAWKSAFAKENSDLKLGKTLRSIDDQVANETEADYLGGFLCYTAGFGLFEKGDEIIRDLYTGYGLSEELPGYPSLNDRVALAKRSATKLKSMVDVFDMANILLATGRYREALAYYNYILNYYQSSEIYNNVGVAAVMSAMELFGPEDLKFKYVTQLDVNFKGSKDIGDGDEISILLNEAIHHFNAAINLDPNYATAYLNKANAYTLLKDFTKAKFYLLEEAKPVAEKSLESNQKILTDIMVLEGIIASETGDNAKGAEKFNEAKNRGSDLGAYNLNVLEGTLDTHSKTTESTFENDNISGTSIDAFFKDLTVNESFVQINDSFTLFQNNPEHEDCRIFLNLEDEEKLYTVVITTSESFTGTTKKGVKLGDNSQKLIDAYGEPNNKIETSNGQFWHYNNKLFLINNDQIQRFTNYETRKLAF